MANTYAFTLPKVELPRTNAPMKFSHKSSFNHGDLVPVDIVPVMPGSTMKATISSVIRMGDPIAPIMDNIYGQFHAFFVPMRLVWSLTKQFFGENTESAGPIPNELEIPNIPLNDSIGNGLNEKSLGFYLGKPILYTSDYTDSVNIVANKAEACVNVSVLKERVYYLIWNEWYRSQQVQDPYFIDIDSAVATDEDYEFIRNPLLKVNKKSDYFTRSTIEPQYSSNAVSIPLGEYAPVISKYDQAHYLSGDPNETADVIFGTAINNGKYLTYPDSEDNYLYGYDSANGANALYPSNDSQLVNPINATNLVADLRSSTSATINNLRYAVALQRYLERENFGSRYFEYLQVHFGTTNPDLVLYRPELLGESIFRININQVLQTAGYSDDPASNTLGTPGANSTTGHKTNLFTKSFGEWGFVAILFATKHDRTYSQGILREDMKLTRFEHYSPEFARLGDQMTKNAEIFYSTLARHYLADTPINKNHLGFGFNEHWMEHKTRYDRVSGILSPSVENSLNYWTLAEDFSTWPSLSPEFLQENRDCIYRALKMGETGPDYIADFFVDLDMIQSLPYHSIPQLSYDLGL